MGASGTFDNDDANNWANLLEKSNDLSLIESTFAIVDEADLYLEAKEGRNALAACEVLARLLGNFSYQNPHTEKVDRWIAAHPLKPSEELLAHAVWVINVILGPQSELRELWERDNCRDWVTAVHSLRDHLKS